MSMMMLMFVDEFLGFSGVSYEVWWTCAEDDEKEERKEEDEVFY